MCMNLYEFMNAWLFDFFNSEDNQNLHPYEHSAKPWSFGSDVSYETTVSSHVRNMMTLTTTTINPW